MARPLKSESKSVLIFNPHFNLIAIAPNASIAAELTGSYPVSVWLATRGKLHTTNNLYFRILPEHIEIDMSDLQSLKLQAFDKLCGIERTYCDPELLSKRTKKFNKNKTVKQDAKRKNSK